MEEIKVILEKQKLSPSDNSNVEKEQYFLNFFKYKYINHSVAMLSWLEIQNRKNIFFFFANILS